MALKSSVRDWVKSEWILKHCYSLYSLLQYLYLKQLMKSEKQINTTVEYVILVKSIIDPNLHKGRLKYHPTYMASSRQAGAELSVFPGDSIKLLRQRTAKRK